MPTGRDLTRDIDGADVRPGECAFWWLGQLSYAVKMGGSVLYLDPFLTPMRGRQVPSLLEPSDLGHAALVFGSHDHADHIDRPAWPAIARAAPSARFVVPGLLAERLAAELGIPAERFIGVDDGRTVQAGNIAVTGVAAAHELLDPDPATGRYPCMGYVVRSAGYSLYHAGDTCVYDGLATTLRRLRPDLMFLPINGRDARRLKAGCIGNMTYQEAADLAGAAEPALTVPGHFEMFAGNTENPQLFADYMAVKYPRLRTHVPAHGERVLVPVHPAAHADGSRS